MPPPLTPQARTASFRRFLRGAKPERPCAILDPSSYAAELAGKPGGYPSVADNLHFIETFPNDSPVGWFRFPDSILPELKWERTLVEERGEETIYAETLRIPTGSMRRVVAEKQGTTPWLIESAIRTADDFSLVDYYADCVMANLKPYAQAIADALAPAKAAGYLTASGLLLGFECYYLVRYPDMPVFYYDDPARYLASIRRIQAVNHALVDELVKHGCEMFFMGSAGLELLSLRIFDEAIIPFTRDITDHIRAAGAFSAYHICGHSRQLIASGRVNQMRPTWFETFSAPPCGNVANLREAVDQVDVGIISKGNLALELLRNGPPQQIQEAVEQIKEATRHRSHIIGQADGTILSGTPHENLTAFLAAAG